MSRALNCRFIKRLTTYLRPKVSVNLIPANPNVYTSRGTKVLLVTGICSTVIKNETPTKIDLDDSLRQACAEGDLALIKLMNQINELVIIVSKEYRACLIRQMEMTKVASLTGPLSKAWDDLTEYRVLADELNKELNDYLTLFNTIGQMSYDDTLVEFVTGTNDHLADVGTKYRELKILLLKEFEENRRMEKELLEIKRDNILENASG